jgi:hypothetical protein
MSVHSASAIIAAFLASGLTTAGAQTVRRTPDVAKFMGREVTIHEPEHTVDNFPKGPATVCIEGPPREQCYTAPQEFGNYPGVELVQLAKDIPALLFSASSGGVSGWEIHLALLVAGQEKELQDLLVPQVTVSSQSQHTFWSEPAISDAKIFLTAEAVWGSAEAHFGDHRYTISVYVRASEDPNYWLEDRYMTVRRYDLDSKMDDVLASERLEILARLKRVVAAQKARLTGPRPIR